LVKSRGEFEEIESLKVNWGYNWKYPKLGTMLKKAIKSESPFETSHGWNWINSKKSFSMEQIQRSKVEIKRGIYDLIWSMITKMTSFYVNEMMHFDQNGLFWFKTTLFCLVLRQNK
jgi:hypothetical protein